MSVVAVKSNTGSTIAIIVTLLGLAAVGYFLVSGKLKDFKFPEIKFPEIKFPEFKFPSLIPEINLEDVSNLSLKPQGEGIDLGQLKQAFKISFPTGSVSRSILPRPILPAGAIGVIGKRLPPRAVALRAPTFIIVREGAKGAPIIAGSKALVDRIAANLRRSTARLPSPPKRTFTAVSKSGRCIRGCAPGTFGTKVAPSTTELKRRFGFSQHRIGRTRR